MRHATGLIVLVCFMGCDTAAPTSATGVSKANAVVKAGGDGLTNEQRNIKSRIEMENAPGAVKHLYVISPESGQALIYSTVKGKVTSSGKRLSPTHVDKVVSAGSVYEGWTVDYGSSKVVTTDPLQDDGTYGSSEPYIFWFDVRDVYHQHFFTGGQIIHVADQPLALKSVVINIEAGQKDNPYQTVAPPAHVER